GGGTTPEMLTSVCDADEIFENFSKTIGLLFFNGSFELEFEPNPRRANTMRRYHHIGIPTTEAKPGETHLKHLKVFVVSHEKSDFGVEWMRFEADAAVPDLVRQVPHVAFEVADLASELAGREILIPPNSPSDGVRVAFIVENGAPIELLEFTDPNHPARQQIPTT
ncbi:MAG TPA: hypothetical protein VKR59_19165, partial [Terriglobales bacterium]|nr:hypothetical protein [Terriglobales bacterium]